MKIEKVVWATTEFVGYHKWVEAPDHRAYLRQTHRHLFKVKVVANVKGGERDIEFHDLLDATDKVIADSLSWCFKQENHAPWSCEFMATSIALSLSNVRFFTNQIETVSVSEDGECGAMVRMIYDDSEQ